MREYQKESKRGTSYLLDETIYSIVVFKIDVFFVLLKEQLTNSSTSENLESFRFKILLSMFRILSMRINLSSEKREEEVSKCLNISSTAANRSAESVLHAELKADVLPRL